ncbi:MAG: PKD repeat protein [Chlorobi bacterium OLB5]|nr:MAG: PKD repeat protein [Chlorobi bacterium OLB5]
MRSKYIFVIFYFCLFTFYLEAQPTQEWVARYERPSGSSGIANHMALDKVGNCYVLGNTAANGGVMVLIKYNTAGDTAWTRTYPQTGNVGVVADSIGNVYITGYFGPSFGPYNIVTIKYNPVGVQQWLKIYDSGGNDECRDIAMDKTGNIYIGGFSDNQSLIIKYNINGDTVWTRKYGETNYRFPGINLILDYQNNVFISGRREHTPSSTGSQFTIKYDSNAVFRWINNPLENLMISPTKTGTDISGNVYVTGQSFNNNILTIKYDFNGNEVWQRIYDGPGIGTDRPSDLKIDLIGNVIITGISSGTGSGSDYLTMKYNSFGDSIWVKTYNGTNSNNDESYSLDIDDSNNVYITGRSINTGFSWDYATIKYLSNGNQIWLEKYNGPPGNAGDLAYVIKLDKFNNVFVTGISDRGGFIYDYATIKYNQLVGIEPIDNEIPEKYLLFQNYPNPFNPVTNIKYFIAKNNSMVNLAVFDVTGRVIKTLVNNKHKTGIYEVLFKPENISSGVYFFKITVDNFTETKKMILIK